MIMERLKARQFREEQTTLNLVGLVLSWWPLIIAAGVISALAAITYLHVTTYRHTASYEVTPVDTLNSSGSFSRTASSLGALTGFNLSQDQQVSPYKLYLTILRQREVAEALSNDPQIMRRIFEGRWDSEAKEWKAPSGLGVSVIKKIKAILGVPTPAWTPPGAADLQAYIRGNVSISEDANLAIATISFDHKDPDFARYFLSELHLAADTRLRNTSLEKARENLEYLQEQLSSAALSELRDSLAEQLGNQVKIIMMANSTAPFAAEPIGDVEVSKGPVKPNPAVVLVLGVLTGPLTVILVIVVAFYARRSIDPNE